MGESIKEAYGFFAGFVQWMVPVLGEMSKVGLSLFRRRFDRLISNSSLTNKGLESASTRSSERSCPTSRI
jgi:hypothetical protein